MISSVSMQAVVIRDPRNEVGHLLPSKKESRLERRVDWSMGVLFFFLDFTSNDVNKQEMV